jgi:hypothetical protein
VKKEEEKKMPVNKVKISYFQLAAIMIVSTLFTFTSELPSIADHSMGRFISLLIFTAVMSLLYIPLILSSSRGESALMGVGNPFLKWFFAVIIVIRLLYIALLTAMQLEFRITCTAMPYLSPIFYTSIIFAAALYGTLKGIQACARVAPVSLAIYVFLIFVVSFLVWSRVEVTRLYTPFASSGIFPNALYDVISNDEIFFFAILCGYVRDNQGKGLAYKSVMFYLPIALTAGLWINFIYNSVLGRLLNYTACQMYTISSFSSFNVIERMDGFFISAAVIGGLLKITVSFICMRAVFAILFNDHKSQIKISKIISSLLLTGLSVCAYFLVSYNKDWVTHGYVTYGLLAVMVITIVILPVFAIISRRRDS